MTEQRSMFALPDPPVKLTGHASKMKFILEIYSSRGLTLEQISDAKILNRKPSVLKGYCRKYLISFPDFIPMAMREKRGKKTKTA